MVAKIPSPSAAESKLNPGWRFLVSTLGVALVAMALVLWFAPPRQTRFAPQASTAGAVAVVDTPSETLSIALLGFGVLLIVVAVNGLRLESLKFGGNEVDWHAAVAKNPKVKEAGFTAQDQQAAAVVAQGLAITSPSGRSLDIAKIADHAIESVRKVKE